MKEENGDPNLSASKSPNTVVMRKKRARTLNNWPLAIALIIIGVVLAALIGVIVKRSRTASVDAVEERSAPATALAKNVMGPVRGGLVEPPTLEIPQMVTLPQQEPPAATPSVPPPAALPDLPKESIREPAKKQLQKMSEEQRKIQELRYRQLEAAVNSPIKVQLDEIKTSPHSGRSELLAVDEQLAALRQNESLSYEERLAAMQTPGTSTQAVGGAVNSGRDSLSGVNQFGSGVNGWENPARMEAPSSIYTIRTGSVIPATLISGINSDLPGQIIGQVSHDVCDTPTGNHVLIPQGSRLVGEYSSQVQYGQSRVFAVWQRIIFPDGKALDLGSMPGSSDSGYAGLRDRVNNHYVRIFGSAIMMSGILAGVEMTQNDKNKSDNNQRMSDALSESLGQVLGGAIAEMLNKNMSIAPTLEIRPGYRLNVMLVKDLVFSGSYRSFDYLSVHGEETRNRTANTTS